MFLMLATHIKLPTVSHQASKDTYKTAKLGILTRLTMHLTLSQTSALYLDGHSAYLPLCVASKNDKKIKIKKVLSV